MSLIPGIFIETLNGLIKLVPTLWRIKVLFRSLRSVPDSVALVVVQQGGDEAAALATAILKAQAQFDQQREVESTLHLEPPTLQGE